MSVEPGGEVQLGAGVVRRMCVSVSTSVGHSPDCAWATFASSVLGRKVPVTTFDTRSHAPTIPAMSAADTSGALRVRHVVQAGIVVLDFLAI